MKDRKEAARLILYTAREILTLPDECPPHPTLTPSGHLRWVETKTFEGLNFMRDGILHPAHGSIEDTVIITSHERTVFLYKDFRDRLVTYRQGSWEEPLIRYAERLRRINEQYKRAS